MFISNTQLLCDYAPLLWTVWQLVRPNVFFCIPYVDAMKLMSSGMGQIFFF